MITLSSQHWQRNGLSFLIYDLSLLWRPLCPAHSQSSSLQFLHVQYIYIKPTKVKSMNFRFAAFQFIIYRETKTPVFASCWLSFWGLKKKKGVDFSFTLISPLLLCRQSMYPLTRFFSLLLKTKVRTSCFLQPQTLYECLVCPISHPSLQLPLWFHVPIYC